MPQNRKPGLRIVPLRLGPDTPKEDALDTLSAAHLALLARAGSVLPASLDLNETAENIVRFLVPSLADLCFLYLDSPPTNVQRWGFTTHTELSPLIASTTFSKRSRLSCGPELRKPPERWAESLTANAEEYGQLSRIGFRSELRVPLIARNQCIGAITLLSSTVALTNQELSLVTQIASIASLAITNCREYAAIKPTPSPAWEIEALNHELRNLVAPILGWARIFKSDGRIQRDAILHEGAESLERNARHAARLIDECLDLSSVHRGTMSMEWRTVDLNAIVEGALQGVRELNHDKGHHVYTTLTPGTLWIEGDGARLQQVLTNLLSNAAKYCGHKGTICIDTQPAGDQVSVTVRDNGQGINPDDLARIGEPFFRGSNRDQPGIGLGLAISRQIVNLHGGQMVVESPGVGKGCVIKVTLPVGRVGRSSPARPIEQHKQARILLVEDSLDVLACLKLQLEALGHSVSAMSDPLEALACARVAPPDLICSDLRFKSLDGYTFAQLIRAQPETAHIPMIAVTGLAGDQHRSAALAAGYNACLIKPVDDDELQHWIDRLAMESGI